MAIPGTCPSCGSKFDLPQALNDAEARIALGAALEFPPSLARLVVPYMALLAPKGRSIAMGKLARLLRELTDIINSGQVTRKGTIYAAPQELWKHGMEETLAARDAGSLILPFKDHNYLCEIVWRAGFKSAGKDERKKEEQTRYRQTTPEPDTSDEVKRNQDKAELVHLRGLHANAPAGPQQDALKNQIEKLEQKLGLTNA